MSSTLHNGIGSDGTAVLSICLPVKSPSVLPLSHWKADRLHQDQFYLSWLVINQPTRYCNTSPAVGLGVMSALGQTILVPRDVRYGILFILLCLWAVKRRLFSQLVLSGGCRQLSLSSVTPKIQLHPLRHWTIIHQYIWAGQRQYWWPTTSPKTDVKTSTYLLLIHFLVPPAWRMSDI